MAIIDLLHKNKGIQKGISPSYMGDFNRVFNCDIDAITGAVMPNWRLNYNQPFSTESTYTALTFTVASTANDIIQLSASISSRWHNGQAVQLTTTDTLPAGLSTGTTYYVIKTYTGQAGYNYVKLADTYAHWAAGTPVNITDSGTGTHTITAEEIGRFSQIIRANGNYVGLDPDNKKIWWSVDGTGAWFKLSGHSTTGSLCSIAYWRNYLFLFRTAKVDILNNTGLGWSGSWTNDWAAFAGSTAGRHPVHLMTNDFLYIGDLYNIASLNEVAGSTFDPTDGGISYTWNTSANNLPTYETIRSLTQIGNKLAIGATGNGSGRIYTWDTFSDSYDSVMETGTIGVYNMITAGNYIYYINSVTADLYITDTNSYSVVAQMPKTFSGNEQTYISDSTFEIFDYDTSMMFMNGKVYYCIGGNKMPGIYTYNILTKEFRYENSLYSAYVGTSKVYFYGICQKGENDLLVSVKEDPNTYSSPYDYQIQTFETYNSVNTAEVGTLVIYRSRTAYLETGFMALGTELNKKVLSQLISNFAKELITGEGVKIYYRYNLTDSYTQVVNNESKGNLDYTTFGSVNTCTLIPADLILDTVQFKIEFTVPAWATTVPELTSLLLI